MEVQYVVNHYLLFLMHPFLCQTFEQSLTHDVSMRKKLSASFEADFKVEHPNDQCPHIFHAVMAPPH